MVPRTISEQKYIFLSSSHRLRFGVENKNVTSNTYGDKHTTLSAAPTLLPAGNLSDDIDYIFLYRSRNCLATGTTCGFG
jgi:hypothetical protein